MCVWVNLLPCHHNFQVLPHVTSLVQGKPWFPLHPGPLQHQERCPLSAFHVVCSSRLLLHVLGLGGTPSLWNLFSLAAWKLGVSEEGSAWSQSFCVCQMLVPMVPAITTFAVVGSCWSGVFSFPLREFWVDLCSILPCSNSHDGLLQPVLHLGCMLFL